jgi:hypothetical protein
MTPSRSEALAAYVAASERHIVAYARVQRLRNLLCHAEGAMQRAEVEADTARNRWEAEVLDGLGEELPRDDF